MALLPALLTAGAIAFGSSAAATKSANKGAKRAAELQQAAATKATDLIRTESQPYRDLGAFSIGQLRSELESPIESGPGFLYKQRQLEKTLHRNLAAIGQFNSGSRIMKDLDITGRLASEEQARRDSLLTTALGIGTSATQNFQTNAANLTIGSGNAAATAATTIGTNNASLFSGIGNAAIGAAGLYSGYKR